MSLISTDKVTDSVHREWSKTRVTSQANLVASPLYESLDVLACPRAYINLTMGRGQVRVRFKVIVKFFERDVQTRREGIIKCPIDKALGLRLS